MLSKVSGIGSDRVRYPDQECEGPASTKGGLIEGHNKRMTVQKLVFHRVQYMLKYSKSGSMEISGGHRG